MHLDDDGDDDAPVFGAPLPQEDRLWRHPSEMASFVGGSPAPARAANGMSGSRLLGVAVVSGLVGAVLAVGVVAVSVGLGTDIERATSGRTGAGSVGADLVSQSAPSEDAAAVATKLASSVLRVIVGGSNTVGSAVVLRTDGYLLTDAALIASATSATVVLGADRLEAKVVGLDPLTDVAVIHVDRTDLVVAPMDDNAPLVGQRIFAVAARAAGDPAVAAGMVSRLDAKVTGADGTVLHGMIQTDAPIDASAIGGALTDDQGVVLALLSGPASTTGGYAVPIATATTMATDIIGSGHARHVWLGVEGVDLDDGSASQLHVAGGASVTKVADGSPASVAGLKGGDVITAVAGTPVTSMSDLVVGLRNHGPGETVDIEFWRDGERQHCTAKLVERTA